MSLRLITISILNIICFQCPVILICQDLTLFIDQSDKLNNNTITGPICRAFADANGDYRDDIIRVNDLNRLNIDISSDNGSRFINYNLGSFSGDAWTIGVGDIDNDGINEVLTSGVYNGMTIWKSENRNTDFIKLSSSSKDFFAQASNFVDINNDGWLDAFICNDEGLSKIFINNGSGQLIDSSGYIDMTTQVPSDNSGNYSSEWTDIDGDGDLDLYIAKCRINATEFNDPRRINALYINDNGNFVESGEEFGINIGAQTWTANFGDIDNDGDMDLFLANHEFRSQLFENIDNNRFSEIEIFESGQELNSYTYQSAMYDFNNDGFIDILLAGENDFLLINNGNKTFNAISNAFGLKDIASFALGDANHDGFIDVLASYKIFGFTNSIPDRLYENFTNENHFIAINLQGTLSNRNGIGTRVEIFGEWGTQTRILQSGNGYGVTHSLQVHFGLNDTMDIDSLKIFWPSGQLDTYKDLSVDAFYLAIENSCLEMIPSINASNVILDCIDSTSLLTIVTESETEWSNGILSDSIVINEAGNYYAEINTTNNCNLSSQSIIIEDLKLPTTPEINVLDSILICDNSLVKLSDRLSNPYQWSDGTFGRINNINKNGNYFLLNSNYCDTVYSDTVNLSFINEENFSKLISDTINNPSEVLLNPMHNNIKWYSDFETTQLISEDDIFLTSLVSKDTSFYYTVEIVSSPPNYIGGAKIEETNGDSKVQLESIALTTWFDVLKKSTLKSFKVNSLAKGPRRFLIVGRSVNQLFADITIDLDTGIQEVVLDTELDVGDYFIQTDETVNLANFGNPGPQLYLITNNLTYPYNIGNLARINTTVLGNNYFGYFFDLNMSEDSEFCEFGPYTYQIIYDPISGDSEIINNKFKIFPNPFSEIIKVKGENKVQCYTILSFLGEKIKTSCPNSKVFEIDTESLPFGTYMLYLESENKSYYSTLIKTNN